MDVRDAATADLDARTLYAILALRAAVFVVEQDCVYLDPDGRDLEPGARQLWIEQNGAVVATLRVLRDPDGTFRIGRVATAHSARRTGLAEALMRRALELAPDGEVVLGAQTYLENWYGKFGFVRDGADYDEDGIPHLPMRLRRPTPSAGLRPDAPSAELRPDAPSAELRPDAPSAELRPDAPSAELRPDSAN